MPAAPLRTTVIALVGILALGAVLYFGYQLYGYLRATSALPGGGQEVLFTESGIGERYVMRDNALAGVVPEPLAEGVIVHESVASPLVPGERIVLVTAPGASGVIAGVLHEDGTITILVTGETAKSNLIVRDDGLAVFVAGPPALPAALAFASEGAEDGIEETFTAAGPAEEPPAAEPPAASELVAVDLSARAIYALGAGHNPRFLEDGRVIALSAEGIVAVDTALRTRTILLSAEGSATPAGGIAPGGDVVALAGPARNMLDFYDLSSGVPSHLGFLEINEDASRVAFTDEQHFFIRIGPEVARFYQIPTASLPVATPIAVVAIVR